MEIRNKAFVGKDGSRSGRHEGLQVVCSTDSGAVLTVCRTHDFRSLRRRNTRWTPVS